MPEGTGSDPRRGRPRPARWRVLGHPDGHPDLRGALHRREPRVDRAHRPSSGSTTSSSGGTGAYRRRLNGSYGVLGRHLGAAHPAGRRDVRVPPAGLRRLVHLRGGRPEGRWRGARTGRAGWGARRAGRAPRTRRSTWHTGCSSRSSGRGHGPLRDGGTAAPLPRRGAQRDPVPGTSRGRTWHARSAGGPPPRPPTVAWPTGPARCSPPAIYSAQPRRGWPARWAPPRTT